MRAGRRIIAPALAVAWLAPALAFAQSNVTVYGLIDAGVVQEGGGAAGSVTKVSSGVSAGSRIGFKGSEDLGGGLSAVFLLESGFQEDTGEMGQGGLLFGRQAYVGLQGTFGTVMAGRQYTPEYLVVVMADPFGSGYVADTKNMVATTGNSFSRMDNTVKYVSPVMRGVTVELAAAPGEVAGSSPSGRQFGGAIGYVGGPLKVSVGYHNRNNDTALVHGTENAKNTVIAAVYDVGPFKLHGLYGSNKGLNSSVWRNNNNPYGYAAAPTASTDSRDLMAGLTIPFGPHTVMASWIHKDDRTTRDQDASQYALGYRYALSKRTELYAVTAHITNRRGASYTVGSAIESGSGNRATTIGMRHSF